MVEMVVCLFSYCDRECIRHTIEMHLPASHWKILHSMLDRRNASNYQYDEKSRHILVEEHVHQESESS